MTPLSLLVLLPILSIITGARLPHYETSNVKREIPAPSAEEARKILDLEENTDLRQRPLKVAKDSPSKETSSFPKNVISDSLPVTERNGQSVVGGSRNSNDFIPNESNDEKAVYPDSNTVQEPSLSTTDPAPSSVNSNPDTFWPYIKPSLTYVIVGVVVWAVLGGLIHFYLIRRRNQRLLKQTLEEKPAFEAEHSLYIPEKSSEKKAFKF